MEDRGGVAIIGGGPAGLMAAEVAARAGAPVVVFDAMPSVGRKFLLAGRGGLNLTHSEPVADFVARYGARAGLFHDLFRDFGPAQLRAWAADLGIETFIGTSGRVFPAEFKAAPLLRAWVRRLKDLGVAFRPRHRLLGLPERGCLRFATPEGETTWSASAVVLALGGASWPRLGSDGSWGGWMGEAGVAVAPLQPANCGFEVSWSPYMATHYGSPVKPVALSFGDRRVRGEVMIAGYGLEGGPVYALSAALRDTILREGSAVLTVDLKPDLSADDIAGRLNRTNSRLSLSNRLRKTLGLTPAAIALLREGEAGGTGVKPLELAGRIKSVKIRLYAPRPIDEAISSAGGLCFAELDDGLMVRGFPGVFAAGEMLDWEAPTGGYLLTGCFATGYRAGQSALAWFRGGGRA
ncbi:MAG: TIGR03862 family flavoprotein [Telmatospirillum sp.]|nr:TIGR03862 family flavoprotein [Telmatospirillum sp.]